MEALLSLLIPALIVCESGGIDNYYNTDTGAAGCLQITVDRLDYVNALTQAHTQATGKQGYIYTIDDCFDRRKASEIAYRYIYHMGNEYRRDNGGKMPDMEALARMWKGGETGYSDTSTIPYWERVKTELDAQAQRRKKHGTLTRPGRIIKTYSPIQGERRYITPYTN